MTKIEVDNLIGVDTVYVFWAKNRDTTPLPPQIPAAAPRAGALPVIFQSPSISLPDQDGNTVNDNALRGKVWIVDFIFTNCGSVCPRMTGRMVELQKRITDPRVQFLSISVDPERDVNPKKKEYAKEHGIDESRWRFVSPPTPGAAGELARAMKIGGAAGAHQHSDPIIHSDRFILVDAKGGVRGAYHLDDPAAIQRLVDDATALTQAVN